MAGARAQDRGFLIDKETPVRTRIGVIVASVIVVMGAGVGIGIWMARINSNTAAIPKILQKMNALDEIGTAAGRHADALIKQDLKQIREKVTEQKALIEDVKETQRKQWDLMREINQKLDNR